MAGIDSSTGAYSASSLSSYDFTTAGLIDPGHEDETALTHAELKSISSEVGEWMWGTIQGCFNRKMTTSQIIVDAIIGVIPLVGDVTAVRDLIATVIGLIKDPERREEVVEWILLVVLLLALIPVAGGVLKGVGRLLVKNRWLGKAAVSSRATLKEIITFLNRVGAGNAVKLIKELNLLKYERQLVRKFIELMDQFTLVFEKIETKLGWFITKEMKNLLQAYRKGVKDLKELGSKMIPKAIKELDKELKSVQKAIYEGEWIGINGTGKNVTREAEARLVEGVAVRTAQKEMKYPKNIASKDDLSEIGKVYQHKPGWPDLMARLDDGEYSNIAAFSGPIEAVTLNGPSLFTRYFDELKAKPVGAYWVPENIQFKNAQEWRTHGAVLDEWNKDGFRVTCKVPPKHKVKAWKGKVSGQTCPKTGQFLEGGADQIFVDLGLTGKEWDEINRLGRTGAGEYQAGNGLIFKFERTGWTDSCGIYGFGPSVRDLAAVGTETLGRYERETKVVLGGARALRNGTNTSSQ